MNESDHQPHAHPPGDFGYLFHHRPPRLAAKRRLLIVIYMNIVMMVAEVVGGIWTNSLALLSDAGHMLTHIFALAVSLVAIRLAERGLTEEKTFGFYRAEPIAALINGITILLIVVVIAIEAVKKFIWPEPVQAREMFVVAVAGLLVNLAGAFVLRESAKDDINIKGSFVHLLTDLFSSIAIVLGGAIIIWTGWDLIDPILSLVICIVVGVWGVRLTLQSTHILMEGVPESVDVAELTRALSGIEGVQAIHDVHVWEVSSGMYAMTCHVQVEDMLISRTEPIRDALNRLLSDRYGIGHTNLQFEQPPADDV
jgi:cobalt-zinc-cadmium efflux system protein